MNSIPDDLRALAEGQRACATTIANRLADIPAFADLDAAEAEIREEAARLEARVTAVRDARRARQELELEHGRRIAAAADLDELAVRHTPVEPVPVAEAIAASGLLLDELTPDDDPSPCAAGQHALCAGCADCPQSCHPDAGPASPYGSFEGSSVPRFPNGRVVPPPGPVELVPPDEVPVPNEPGTVVATSGPTTTIPHGLTPPPLNPLPAPPPGETRGRHEKPKQPKAPKDSTTSGAFRVFLEKHGLVSPATAQEGDA